MENGGSVLIKLLFCLVPMPLFSNFMVAAWFSTFYNPKLSPTSLTYDSHAPLQSFSIYLYAATMKSILMHDTVLSVSNYVKTYDSYNCLELITKPTRITTTSSTLIDHIYTNMPATKLTPGILINDLSDHLPVFVSINSKIFKKWDLKSCNRHDYSNFNAEHFVTEVQEALDNLPINQSNPCETLDSGILMLEQCLNEQAPIKKLSKAKQKLSHKP